MIIYILLVIAPYLQKNDTIKKIEGFDSISWKTDSIGCQGKKSILAKILISNKDKIVGYSKIYIENMLGKPNSIDKQYGFYLIANGPQCLHAMDNYDLVECRKLMIQYENCKVKNLSIILP